MRPLPPRTAVRSALVPVLVAGLTAALALGGAGAASPTAAPAAASTASCPKPARGFVPTRAVIPAIGRSVRVIQVKRTRSGRIGAGPTNTAGKWLMAMDPHRRPGGRRGTVILSGHAWPDGSALGNALSRSLRRGDRVVLIGKNGRRACYQVRERASYPKKQTPRRKALRPWGPEQLVIITCSGKRLGPGRWTRRTVWYASPLVQTPPAPASPTPTSPQSTPTSGPADGPNGGGGLLGGLLGGS